MIRNLFENKIDLVVFTTADHNNNISPPLPETATNHLKSEKSQKLNLYVYFLNHFLCKSIYCNALYETKNPVEGFSPLRRCVTRFLPFFKENQTNINI